LKGSYIMAKKQGSRGQNEGSIREKFRKDKVTGENISIGYEARFTVDGKQKSIFAKTRAEVNKNLTKALNDINQGSYAEPSKIVVSEWLDTWFKTYKMPHVKPQTLQSYDNIIRNHINPEIGTIALKDLKPEKVQALYNSVLKDHSQRLTELTHVVLHSSLQQALKNGLVYRNVTDATIRPKNIRVERKALSVVEQKKFLKAIKGHRLEAAFIMDLYTGMRRGETVALLWKNVDFIKKEIKVVQTMTRVKNFNPDIKAKTVLSIGTTKTASSNRIIPLLDEVVAVLKAHKARQAAERLKVGNMYQDKDLVFCTEIGTPLEPGRINKIFNQVLETTGIEHCTPHTLRHSFATRGLENGIELKVMQELLGHASIIMTANTYSHVLDDKKREAIGKLKKVYNSSK
jgi:integrase